MKSDTGNLTSKLLHHEQPLIQAIAEIREIRLKLMTFEKENSGRFQSISSVLKVFAETLRIAPPTFVERSTMHFGKKQI